MSMAASKNPRLTIVIPTLNRASLVGRAVESALAQTSSELEIVVSNNGSTDDTRRVLERYAREPRLTIFHRGETIPATDHANFLLESARGDFFLGLSDDDWLEPDFTSRVLDAFDRHPGLSFVWTGCAIHYADVAMPAKTGPEVEPGTSFLAAFLSGERNVCWCACVTRTADLRRIGPIPPGVICGDMFYWTKLAPEGKVGCVSSPLSHYVFYRDGSDGHHVNSSVLEWARDTRRWIDDIVASLEKSGLAGKARRNLHRRAAQFLFRSTANQFVWQALRGVNRGSLLASVWPSLRFLHGPDPSPWMRVVASLVAPRRLLRRRMLAEAERKASSAGLRLPVSRA
ncbi:MAG: glycosyltransferase family A protein [Thermoanaerobaculia bacterium]